MIADPKVPSPKHRGGEKASPMKQQNKVVGECHKKESENYLRSLKVESCFCELGA